MNELIKITTGNDGRQAVSARELHAYVEMSTRFDIWIKRMFEYGFTQGVDFECLYKNVQMPNGGSKVAIDDYALSIDCAKEISMLQRNDKGKRARQYFIEVEKKYRNGYSAQIPQSYSEALRLAAEQAEQLEMQQKQLQAQAPKVVFADAVATSQKSCLVGEMAKILRQNGIDMGQQRLFKWLRHSGFLCKQGERYNQPTQRAMDMELIEIKKTSISRPDGTIMVTTTPKITGKGQIYFVNLFLKSEMMLAEGRVHRAISNEHESRKIKDEGKN